MTASDNNRHQIIEYAMKQFFTYGYSKVSTDSLAAGLAMSKSTLYNYFPRKEQLLDAAVETFHQTQLALIGDILQDNETALRPRIEKFLRTVIGRLAVFRPEAALDIKRTRPQVYERLYEIRRDVILGKLALLFRQGAESGDFRGDIDAEFVVDVLFAAIDKIGRPDYLMQSPYSYDKAVTHIFTLVFEGIIIKESRC